MAHTLDSYPDETAAFYNILSGIGITSANFPVKKTPQDITVEGYISTSDEPSIDSSDEEYYETANFFILGINIENKSDDDPVVVYILNMREVACITESLSEFADCVQSYIYSIL